jgi:hypothetical protein
MIQDADSLDRRGGGALTHYYDAAELVPASPTSFVITTMPSNWVGLIEHDWTD